MMNFETLKNELENDGTITVYSIENGFDGIFIYDNALMLYYDTNWFRIIFDENHVLIQVCDWYDVNNGKYSFDGATDYIGNHFILNKCDSISELIISQVQYFSCKYGNVSIRELV